jgi:hypothetical protein
LGALACVKPQEVCQFPSYSYWWRSAEERRKMKREKLAMKGLRTSGVLIFILIIISMISRSDLGQASEQSAPCTSEPTDMTISYGDAITCSIDTEGDSDLFRFNGSSGETIVVQSVWNSGSMRPCIELVAPDNSRVEACENAFTNRIDATLTQTGDYTVIADVFFGGTGDYVLALERLISPSPNAQAIQFGELIEDQINPEGELDLFFFDGTAGESILLQTAWQDGSMRPCIQLIAPDNSRTLACQNAFTNRVDTTLDQTGTYAVLADVFFGGTGDYALVLERLISPSPNAQAVSFGDVVMDEINPVGDLDLYKFTGKNNSNILLKIVWESGSMRPCLELIYPDNQRSRACNNAFSNQLDITLNQTGNYAILADVFFGGTGNYTLELQCISGECSVCSVEVALGVSNSNNRHTPLQMTDLITLYTRFRDETLGVSSVGREYIDLYNEHTTELAGILIANSDLMSRTAQFLDNASDEIASLLPDATTEAILDQALYDEANVLVQDLAAAGSSEFRDEMLQVWSNMALDQHIGETVTDIWGEMHSFIYLPIVIK